MMGGFAKFVQRISYIPTNQSILFGVEVSIRHFRLARILCVESVTTRRYILTTKHSVATTIPSRYLLDSQIFSYLFVYLFILWKTDCLRSKLSGMIHAKIQIGRWQSNDTSPHNRQST